MNGMGWGTKWTAACRRRVYRDPGHRHARHTFRLAKHGKEMPFFDLDRYKPSTSSRGPVVVYHSPVLQRIYLAGEVK